MRIDIRRVDNVLVLKPSQRPLQAWSGSRLKKALSSLAVTEGSQVIVNLSAVGSLDSEGLAALVSLAQRVGGKGKILLCHAREAVKGVLVLTRLNQVFPVFPGEEEALAALAAKPHPPESPQEIQLVISSSLQHIAFVGVAVKALCASLALPQVDACQLELCAVEAVTNAIKHAYDGKPGFLVQVLFAAYADRLVLTVCDEGRKMPQLVIRSLDFDPTDLASLPESGMGLFLIQQIMDEVTYTSEHGKNALTMIKRL